MPVSTNSIKRTVRGIPYVPYARELATLLNRPPSQKCEIDPLCCPIHAFMLFLDELAQEKEIEEVSL